MLEKYQLRNGLKVILYPSKKSPVVTVQAWVKTGSADEKKSEEGISHFIEHLLFKGTRKFKVGEIASIIEGSGGELNAYTSFDQTVFHITISKQFQDIAFDTLSEMMGFPSFDESEIDNEREVVVEEIKRSNDNPHRAASRLLFSSVYKKHPYRKPVIGFEENVRSFSKKKILNYYHGRYSPKNMSLIIVGDIDPKEIRQHVESTFGKIPMTKVSPVARTREGTQTAPQVSVGVGPFLETTVHVAWRVPSIKHPDTPALDILALILGQGDSSRLTQRARLERPLVNYVGAHAYSPQDEGFFVVSAGLNVKNLEEYFSVLGEEVLKLQLAPVEDQEIKKAITILEAEEIFGVETVDGLARKLGTFELLFSQPDFYLEYLKKLRKVTVADILNVARRYLISDRMTVAIMANESRKEVESVANKFTHDIALAEHAFRKVKPAAASKKTLPVNIKLRELRDVQKIEKTDVEGVPFVVVHNEQAPILSLRLAFRGGQRAEPNGKDGVGEFLANTLLCGAGNYSEQQIADTLDSHAMSIRPFAGRNTVGVSLSCLENDIEIATDLLKALLQAPHFEKNAVERERVIMLESIKQKHDNPAMVAIQNFQEMMFEGHPYAKDPSGTEKTIMAISVEDIKSFWKNTFVRSDSAIVAAGSVECSTLKPLVKNILAPLEFGASKEQYFDIKPITQDKERFHQLQKEQSHIVYGVRGLTLFDPSVFALHVLQSVLAGQGGRLFIELRDKASLAYSVSPMQTEGIDVGYFGAYIGCSPEKGRKALEMMELEFNKLASEKISVAELDRAKKYLIGRHDIGLQRNSSVAGAILFEEIYGQSYKNVFDYPNSINGVTREDVLVVAQRLFSQNKVLSVVGPKW